MADLVLYAWLLGYAIALVYAFDIALLVCREKLSLLPGVAWFLLCSLWPLFVLMFLVQWFYEKGREAGRG